jgi:hypothetical protein
MKMKALGPDPKKPETKPAQQPAQGAGMGGAFSSIFGFAKSSLQKTLNLG